MKVKSSEVASWNSEGNFLGLSFLKRVKRYCRLMSNMVISVAKNETLVHIRIRLNEDFFQSGKFQVDVTTTLIVLTS